MRWAPEFSWKVVGGGHYNEFGMERIFLLPPPFVLFLIRCSITGMEVKEFLEEILGRRVDLVTPAALKPQLWEAILEEAVDATWK